MTDTDALQRYARRRDPDAFAHLVESYQRMVYAVCLRRLGNEADARDAAQDTFVKLARSADAIQESVVGWLHRCATTTSLDLVRRELRRRDREHRAEAAMRVAVEAAPHDPAWAEVRAALDDALEELPAAQRDLIVQRYLAGRKQADLAAEAGVSESLMSRRVHAAVDALRQRLQSKGFAVGLGALTAGFAAESAVALPSGLTASLTGLGTAGVVGTTATTGSAAAAATTAGQPAASLGWMWLGTKIKLSTAILGSLATHAALVGVYFWFGSGDISVQVPPSPASQPPIPVAAPLPAAPPPADRQAVIRIADAAAAAEPPRVALVGAADAKAFVYVMGSIQRPGAYTLPPDGRLILKQLIASAGGAGPIDGREVTLTRRGQAENGEPHSRVVVRAPLREIYDGPLGDTVLEDNDLVVLGEPEAGIEPSILDPALTGDWRLRVEDREGNLIPDAVDRWAWGARFRFVGDEVSITFADGASRLRYRLPADDVGLDDDGKWMVLLEAPADSELRKMIGQRVPMQWGHLAVQGNRAYVGTSSKNPATDEMGPIAPGEFDHRGYRTFLVRPDADPLRDELDPAAPKDRGWLTIELFDIDESPPGRPRFVDFERDLLLRLPGEVDAVDNRAVFDFIEREKIDLVAEVALAGQTILISPLGDDPNGFVSQAVGELPFTTTLKTAEGADVQAVVEEIDAETKSLTLRYRILVAEIESELTAAADAGPDALDAEIEPQPAAADEFAYVMGRVRNPGAYRVRRGQRLSLLQIIASAGGATENDPAKVRVTLVRRVELNREETLFDGSLAELLRGGRAVIGLRGDDLVNVGVVEAQENAGEPPVLTVSTQSPEKGGVAEAAYGPEGHVEFENYAVRDIAVMAYGMPGNYRMEWEVDPPPGRFDADLPGPDWQQILRVALRERFGLTGRVEQRPFTVYALRVPAEGMHRLKESDEDGGGGVTSRPRTHTWTASQLVGLANNMEIWLDTPVRDETGLEQRYDFTLNVDRDAGPEAMAEAVRRDLGLELVNLGEEDLPVVVMSRVE